MADVRLPIRIRSINAILREEHGSVRPLTADELRVLSRYARLMELSIEDVWPVDTGRSRDGWSSRLLGPREDGPGILIWNPVEYVSWVHYAGRPAVIWQQVVRDAIAQFRGPLLQDMRAEIRRTEARLDQGADFLDIISQSFRPSRFSAVA